MFTARIVTESSDTSTLLGGPASILLMRHESGALLADEWVEIEVDDEGAVRVSAGEGDDEPAEVYDSRRAVA